MQPMRRYNRINAIHNQKKLTQNLQLLIDLRDGTSSSNDKKYSITGEDRIIHVGHQKNFLRRAYQAQSAPFLSQKIRSSLMWDKVFVAYLAEKNVYSLQTNVAK